MNEVTFQYNLESYQRSNGVVSDFGEIYIKTDTNYFPEKNWTDFGCKAVYIWADEFVRLLVNSKSKVECNFYDGAFLFYLETIGNTWQMTFVDEDSDKDFEFQVIVEPFQISTNLLKALRFMKSIRQMQGSEKSFSYYQEREIELLNAIKGLE